jgi:hypothetical protein
MLAANAVGTGIAASSLTREQLTPLIRTSTQQWSAMGLDTTSLSAVRFEIVDLPGRILGQYTSGVIQIDHNAAGMGWFIDRTPSSGSEFAARGSFGEIRAVNNSPALGHVDLLTVISHELGHAAGLADEHSGISEIMEAELSTGVRRFEQRTLTDHAIHQGRMDQSAAPPIIRSPFFGAIDARLGVVFVPANPVVTRRQWPIVDQTDSDEFFVALGSGPELGMNSGLIPDEAATSAHQMKSLDISALARLFARKTNHM